MLAVVNYCCDLYIQSAIDKLRMFCTGLHNALKVDLNEGLVDHNLRDCIVCNPGASNHNGCDNNEYSQLDQVFCVCLIVISDSLLMQ